MPKHGNIPPKADHLPFASWDGEQWLFPSADAIYDAIISHSGGTIAPYEQYRFIDLNNTAAGRDGSVSNPYNSLTEAYADVTDATVLKRYQFLIFPGTYAESVTFKPYINLRGVSKEAVQLQGAYTITNPGRVLLQDLTVNGTVTVNSSGFASGTVFDMHTVDLLGAVSWAGRGAGSDGASWNYVRAYSTAALTGVAFNASNSYFYGALTLGTSGTVPSGGNLLSAAIKSSYMGGTLNISAAATHSAIARFWSSTIGGTTTLTNNGVALVAEFDAISWPQGTFNISGATLPVVNRLNQATNKQTIAGSGGIATVFSAHKDLVRAVYVLMAIEHATASEYSSMVVHAVHNDVTARGSASEVGDRAIQARPSTGISGNQFEVYLTNNETVPITVEARIIDI